jgi:hypothetical protein
VYIHLSIELTPEAAMSVSSGMMGMSPAVDRPMAWATALAVVLWLAITGGAGLANVFVAPPSQPPLPLLVALLTPPLVFAVAYWQSSRFRVFALSIDPRWLTAVQGWRVIGGVFLVLYAYGLLPGLFAFPAGFGDLAVGLAAPFVMLAIVRDAPGWPRQVLWLNLAGLADFAGAVSTGVLTSNTSLGVFADAGARANMGELPLGLIPTFAVPLWIVVHAVALLQLARGRRS